MTTLKTVIVDLTPVLPGGENGGAKIFVLELVARLAARLPQTRFVLLTRASSHSELAYLDRTNLRRELVVSEAPSGNWRVRLAALDGLMLARMPEWVRAIVGRLGYSGFVRAIVGRLGYSISRMLRRSGRVSLLRKLEADLLFCPFTAPTYHEQGIPTVCTIYDLQFRTYPEFFTAEDVAQRRCSFDDACRRASALAAISDYSRQAALAFGYLEDERIRTIHLRLAGRGAASSRVDAIAELGLTRGRYLLYPANFWRHKNHQMLLTAFGIAMRTGLASDVKLVCTGAPGPRQAEVAAAVESMGIGERVLLTGYLADDLLAAVVAGAGGLVFPSLYEGFGLPVLEAMAAGVPVACSNAGSLPEIAAGAAVMFDPLVPSQIVDAMLQLFTDSGLRDRLISAGREHVLPYLDADRMTEEYIALFDFAVARQRTGDGISGQASDGWLGERLHVEVAPAAAAQTVELEIEVPPWFPHPALIVRAGLRDEVRRRRVAEVAPGQQAVLRPLVGAQGGLLDIEFTPTATPASLGIGDNPRQLAAQMIACRIVRAEGSVALYPEHAP